MMPLTHEKAQEWILLKQEVSAKDREALSSHLAACPDCRSYVALVRELSQVLPSVYLSPALSPQEIRAKVNATQSKLEKNTLTTRLFGGARKLVWIAATVAVFAVLFFVIYLVLPRSGAPATGPATKHARPSSYARGKENPYARFACFDLEAVSTYAGQHLDLYLYRK